MARKLADPTTAARRQLGLGALLVGGLAALAVLAPLVAPYDPLLSVGRPFQAPTVAHPLGTNDLGQDIVSGSLWSARWTLAVALVVTLASTILSWAAGLAGGFWHRLDAPITGLADLVLALPTVPLALFVLTLVGPSYPALVAVLVVFSWPGYARIVRARVLALRGRQHVLAARALGATELRLARRHILPGTSELLPAKVALTVRFAVFGEATFAFLGLGDPSVPSWGTMLGRAFNDPLLFARPTWGWVVGPPALAIALTILGATLLSAGIEAGGLRAVARPHSHRRKAAPRPEPTRASS